MLDRLAAAAVLAVAAAFPLAAQSAADDGVEPWTEAVVSVTDLEESAGWLVDHGGWREVASGALDPSEIAYWNLPESVTGAFLKICAPEVDAGCVRYVRFDGAEQRVIRLAARPWDTGGIFSIMLRTEDARAAFDAAIARGWWAESQPYAFTFGGSDLVNVVIRGPHGVNYALYERKAPPFDAFPVGALSRAFNAMRMVKDQPKALAFYRDTLGFGVLFDAPFTDPEPRSNNFSVPANLATSLVRRAAVAQPVLPGETGRVEVMEFEGFEGRDFSEHASPPNLGIISLRYPVRDLGAYLESLAARGLEPTYESDAVTIPGIGTVAIAAVRDPDGNLTEFYDAP
ncbi:VOC family protein [Erythrobacter sp.]|uniref:VOC family protein n=1 Tax=Erythrobacter sp. TaxID=1042 RepID=UPI001425FFED|nr:VOC family protein [Erythrobacter sp.]QIQ87195.1 MAG: VOC family protein [Erythrobacter sp.]